MMWLFMRLYRALFRLLPPDFQERYARDAADLVGDRLRPLRGFILLARGSKELVDLMRVIASKRSRRAPTRKKQVVLVTAMDDARHAWRRLAGNGGTTLIAVGLLAAGVGLTGAMFAVLDSLLFRPVPFQNPDELASVRVANAQRVRTSVSFELINGWRSLPVFTAVHGAVVRQMVLEGGVEPLLRSGALITPGTFEMLGVRPIAGRSFLPREGRPGAPKPVVVSEEIWRRHFSADPGAIGRDVEVSGERAVLVGVMPAEFRYPLWDTEVWQPLDVESPPAGRAIVMAVARRQAATSIDDTMRVATGVLHAVEPESSQARVAFHPLTASFLDRYSRSAATSLAVAAGLVFLAICVNVANLTLARTIARRQDFAVCSALGASRSRLLRQVIIEHISTGMAGCLLGIVVAGALVLLARNYLPEPLLARTLNPLDLDWRSIAATSSLALVATVFGGVVPAWFATRHDVRNAGSSGGRATTSKAERQLSRILLVAQIALASTLLVTAGVLARSFVALSRAPRGLDTHNVLAGWIVLPSHAFENAAARYAFMDALEANVRALPGVLQAAASYGLPPGSAETYFGEWRADARDSPPHSFEMNVYAVSREFFELFGIELRQGELPVRPQSINDVVIGEALANRLWPGTTAVGRTFGQSKPDEFRVVGVVREIRTPGVDPRRDRPEMYRPLRFVVDGRLEGRAFGSGNLHISIKCHVCPDASLLRQRIQAINPHAVIQQLRPIEDNYLNAFSVPRSAAAVTMAFATIALLASAGGLFGMLNYLVARRTREFAIRVAIGASPANLRRLVIREASLIAALGLTLGTAVWWVLSATMPVLLNIASDWDVVTWLTVVVVISATTLSAAANPARRAARINPLMLLRHD